MKSDLKGIKNSAIVFLLNSQNQLLSFLVGYNFKTWAIDWLFWPNINENLKTYKFLF